MVRRAILDCLAVLMVGVALAGPASAAEKTFFGGIGDWTNAASWSPPGVPLPADTVFIETGTVTLATDAVIAGFAMTGGTLQGGGNLTVNGPVVWNGGQLAGAGTLFANDGITLLGSSGTLTLNQRTIRLDGGSGAMSGATTQVAMQNNAQFDNRATFAVTGDDGAAGTQGFSGSGVFVNNGLFRKILPANTGQTLFNVAFSNAGQVEVDAGRLTLAAGGASSGGSFTVGLPGTLEFTGGGFSFDASSTIGGSGSVALRSTATMAGTYDVSGATEIGGGTVTFSGVVDDVGDLAITFGTADFSSSSGTITPASLSLSNGILTGGNAFVVDGPMTWSGGGIAGLGAFTANQGITLSGSAKSLEQRTVTVAAGVAAMTGTTSSIQMSNGAVFAVDEDATLDFSLDGGSLSGQGFFGSGTLRNDGLVRKSGGTGETAIEVDLKNEGAVEVDAAALRLGGDTSGGGTYSVAAGARLEFADGDHEIDADGGIAGGGTVRFTDGVTTISGAYEVSGATEVDGGLVSFSGLVNATGAVAISGGSADFSSANDSATFASLDLSAGELTGSDTITVNGLVTWTGGEIEGTSTPNAVLDAQAGLVLGDGNKRLNSRTLRLSGGTTTMSGAANTIQMLDGALFDNQATFLLQNDGGDDQQGFFGEGAFINQGTFRKNAVDNTGTTRFEGVAFANSGLVEILAGNLRCDSGYQQTDGVTRLAGGGLEVSPVLEIAGGVLKGAGTIVGSVLNAGELRPGSPGSLIVTGAFTQADAGRLVIEIGGPTPAQYDRLLITGAAQLGGTLDIRLVDQFVPDIGTTFAIISFAGHSGFFADVLGLDIGDGRIFALVTNQTGIVLTTIAAGSTPTSTETPLVSPTPTATATSVPTATSSATASFTAPPTTTPTASATNTAPATATSSASATSTVSPSATGTATATGTVPATATATDTAPPTASATASSTAAATNSATPTASFTTTASATPTDSATASATPTSTPSATQPTATATASETLTPSATPTDTATTGPSPTATASAMATDTAPPTATPTITETPAPTATATLTRTATASATITQTPIATATLTPTATVPVPLVTIVVGSASGEPGESVFFDVTLQAQVNVTGLQNDVGFEFQAPIAALSNGQPDCVLNPAIATLPGQVFGFLPPECTPGNDCTSVRAVVLPLSGLPIASGSVLYTCRVDIAVGFPTIAYPLTCLQAGSGDSSVSFPTTCTSGSISVGPPDTPTRTPTATPIPPSATVTGTRTPTPPPPATPTNTRRPSSNDDDACQIAAPGEHGSAWLLLLPLVALLVRRRRP